MPHDSPEFSDAKDHSKIRTVSPHTGGDKCKWSGLVSTKNHPNFRFWYLCSGTT